MILGLKAVADAKNGESENAAARNACERNGYYAGKEKVIAKKKPSGIPFPDGLIKSGAVTGA